MTQLDQPGFDEKTEPPRKPLMMHVIAVCEIESLYFLVWSLPVLLVLGGSLMWFHYHQDEVWPKFGRSLYAGVVDDCSKKIPSSIALQTKEPHISTRCIKISQTQSLSEAAVLRVTGQWYLSIPFLFALFCASIAAIVVAAEVIVRRLRTMPLWILAIIIAGYFLPAFVFQSLNGTFRNLFVSAWSPVIDAALPSRSGAYEMLAIPTILAFASLTIAICSVNFGYRDKVDNATENRLSHWQNLTDRANDLHLLLYVWSLHFSLGILCWYYWLSLNVAIVAPDAVQFFADIARNLATGYGVFYSLVLVTSYYPSFLRLQRRAYKYALVDCNARFSSKMSNVNFVKNACESPFNKTKRRY